MNCLVFRKATSISQRRAKIIRIISMGMSGSVEKYARSSILPYGNDVSGKQAEQKLKNDMGHGIATPSAVGQEAVQACMVSLGSGCCLNDAADAVAAT